MKLYPDTEKELFPSDYVPLPELSVLNPEELSELRENLYAAFDNSYIYHSDLLSLALYPDIETIENYIGGCKK